MDREVVPSSGTTLRKRAESLPVQKVWASDLLGAHAEAWQGLPRRASRTPPNEVPSDLGSSFPQREHHGAGRRGRPTSPVR